MKQNTLVKGPAYTNLIELLQHQARINGHKTCFSYLSNGIDVVESITYSELEIRAKAIAVEFRSLSKSGDRAMLLMPNGIDYIVGFWACIYAGLIAVTAYPPQHKRRDWGRLNNIMKDSEASVVLCSQEYDVAVASWLKESAHSCRQFVVGRESLSFSEQWSQPDIDANSVAYLQYSSGSTGSPKGVVLGHGNLVHNTSLIAKEFYLDSSSNVVTWLPMYHDMGFVGGVLSPMMAGASVWLLPPPVVLQTPFLWLKAISDYKAVMSGGPNFIYEHCVARISEEQKSELNLSLWRFAANGAEPIQIETLVRFYESFSRCGLTEKALKPCYGMAETCLFITATAHDLSYRGVALEKAPFQQGKVLPSCTGVSSNHIVNVPSSGRINDQMSIRIVDPETKLVLPDNLIGEIWVRGGSVAQGYWNKLEATEETFGNILDGENGYLRTGDLGFVLDGWLYVSGRAKEVVIVNGRNLYPQDIEATVQSVDGVLAAHGGAVFETLDNQVVVVQELTRQGMRCNDHEQIILKIRQAVAEVHEISLHSVLLIKPVSLPKTTSGKIQRLKSRDLYVRNEFSAIAEWFSNDFLDHARKELIEPDFVANDEASIRNWICFWIASRLKIDIDEVDFNQKLAATGLDSIDAMTLTHELSQKLENTLSAELIWQYPTASELAEFLAKISKKHTLQVKSQSAFSRESMEEESLLEGEI